MCVRSTKWFESYLGNRSQLVNIGKNLFRLNSCNLWCPSGEHFGALLFLCYVNDMVISIDTDCKLLLYTHGSKILFSHSDPDQIANKLRKNLESCSALLVDNKLSLHLGKSECILFGPKRKLKKVKNFKKVSEYDQEIPNSQTADNPMAPRGRAPQPSRDTRKTN